MTLEGRQLRIARSPEIAADGSGTRAADNGPRPGQPEIKGVKPAIEIDASWRYQEIARFCQCDTKTVRRMVSSGRLPKPDFVVGRKSPRWLPQTIERWAARGGKK